MSAADSALVAAALRAGEGTPEMAAAFAARTAAVDAAVLAAVGDGFDVVVNLGAGLDDRARRLPLPAGLRWLDVDRAHAPIALDVTDSRQLAGLLWRHCARAHSNARLLVLSEGLLPYLTTAEVEALAAVLLAAPGFARWAVTWCTPAATAQIRAVFDCPGEGFGCDDPRATFEALGFRVVCEQPIAGEGAGLIVLEPATASRGHHAV